MLIIQDIIPIALLFCLPWAISCFKIGYRWDSHENATNDCLRHGKEYKLINPMMYPGSKYFMKRKVHEAWLPYIRVTHKGPLWTDGTAADKDILSLAEKLGHSCGAIDLESGYYDFLPCYQQGSSFVCQIGGCKACYSIGLTSFECIVLGHDCFTFHCGSSNWYRARELCRNLGGDLAVIKDPKAIVNFQRFWKPTYQSPCSSAWIGLSKEFWISKSGESPNTSVWANDEPKSYGNCSLVILSKGELVWQTVSCEEMYPYFCAKGSVTTVISNQETLDSKSDPTENTSAPDVSDKNLTTKIIVILSFAMVILIASGLLLVYMKQNKLQESSFNHHQQQSREENTPLTQVEIARSEAECQTDETDITDGNNNSASNGIIQNNSETESEKCASEFMKPYKSEKTTDERNQDKPSGQHKDCPPNNLSQEYDLVRHGGHVTGLDENEQFQNDREPKLDENQHIQYRFSSIERENYGQEECSNVSNLNPGSLPGSSSCGCNEINEMADLHSSGQSRECPPNNMSEEYNLIGHEGRVTCLDENEQPQNDREPKRDENLHNQFRLSSSESANYRQERCSNVSNLNPGSLTGTSSCGCNEINENTDMRLNRDVVMRQSSVNKELPVEVEDEDNRS